MNNLPCACDSDHATILGFFIGILVMNVFFTFRSSFSPTVYLLPYKPTIENFTSSTNGDEKKSEPPVPSVDKSQKSADSHAKISENRYCGSIRHNDHHEVKKHRERTEEMLAGEHTCSEIPPWYKQHEIPVNLMSSKNGNKYMTNIDMEERNVEHTGSKNLDNNLTDDEIEKFANL